MNVPGRQKRIHDFAVERRWTMLRLYGDRSKLFAKLALAIGLVVGAAWLMAVELSPEGRANIGRYIYVSWLDWQQIQDPVELTLDGAVYRARPAQFVKALRETDYQGRTAADLITRSLWAGVVGALVGFGAITYLAGRTRPVETDDEVIKGKGMRGQAAFQDALFEGSKKSNSRGRR